MWCWRPTCCCACCATARASPRGLFGLLLIALPTAAAGALGLTRRSAFLLALLYWNARTSSALMAESLFYLLEGWQPAPGGPPEAVRLRSAILFTVFLAAHAAALAAMLYALRRQLGKRRLPLHRRELCCLALVPTAGILFGQVISRLLMEEQDGVLLQLYRRHPAFLAVVPVLALLFYAGAYLTIVFQQGLAALQEERAVLFAERQQTQAIRARIHEAEGFYAQIRELKHEMRGHLTNLKGLALRTGNPVTDVIVNDTGRRCRELGVRFQAEFHYPDPGAYDAFDVGIILQNLLQNAVEACEKADADGRFIALAGKGRGRFFLIEVKNSYAGEVVFGPDGLPVTTKQEASLHGVGLANVRREAEKYMGELELSAARQVFSATVLLQERSTS